MDAISVSKLNTYIKQIFDAEELLHNIPVVGEVFGVSFSRNVIYFSLKDEGATLPCVCFYPNYLDKIVEGDKVVVTGSPNFYIKGGKLNFNVVKLEKVGLGNLYEEFVKLKEKLAGEGLFDQAHKKILPQNIKRIGVITSKEGAVIQDIKNVAWRRNPSVDIVLFNTKVQGNFAEQEIAHAIEVMGQYDNVDVIIVARGGGSLEDLWAYNTEIVARATFNCPKPIISAVGHETDFTIIDFVSDLRAPTPSAAAELVTVNVENRKQDFIQKLNAFKRAIDIYIDRKCDLATRLNATLTSQFEKYLQERYYSLGLLENTLNKINPQTILEKGYARIEQQGKPIKFKKDISYDDEISIVFRDGTVKANPNKKEM